MHDESIGFVEASEVVIAKMHKEASQAKRQVIDYNRADRVFEVTTYYVIEHGDSTERKQIKGIPHTEVLAFGAVRTGCITYTREAISKLHLLSSTEPGYVHQGYMEKGLKK